MGYGITPRLCYSSDNRCIILEKSSLLLENGIPDCGRYEVFSEMNAGDEMLQNTGHFLSCISPENDHDDLSSIEKYALRAYLTK